MQGHVQNLTISHNAYRISYLVKLPDSISRSAIEANSLVRFVTREVTS